MEILDDSDKKLEVIRAAARHDYPTADIDIMLAGIDQGHAGTPVQLPLLEDQPIFRNGNLTQLSRIVVLSFIILISVSHAQQAPDTAQSPTQRSFELVGTKVIEQRLQSYKGNDSEREVTLKSIFQAAGCSGDELSEQPVKGLKQPNVVCVLPGRTDSVILVGAHFDHVDAGDGVVDNWTGASILPSLYQAISTQPRRHTFIFVGFAGEEKGLVGSHFYSKNLTAERVKKIDAMITMDTLGLGPTEVWASRSNELLVGYLNGTAHAMDLSLRGMNVDGFGESDEEYFRQRKVPTITIHSLTRETIPVIHSKKDKYDAVRFADYYDSYKLMVGYLVVLDGALENPIPQSK